MKPARAAHAQPARGVRWNKDSVAGWWQCGEDLEFKLEMD
jgi:hypothetical protein